MASKEKNFLVSTADFAYYVKDVLACTGTTNLNTSIDVSMQEQNVNGGKGNKLVYSYKYGRELAITLESADWKLEYIAANVGSAIAMGLHEVYNIAECVDIINGIGTLKAVPIGDVAVELNDGSIVTVTPTKSTIDLTANGVTTGTVQATYKHSATTKRVTIDADSTPMVGTLILDSDRHSNTKGKIGSVKITVPSYQLNGSFSMNFTPDGVVSTNMDGKALAVAGDRCSDGSGVYAYIDEIDDSVSALTVNDIAVTPAVIALGVGEDKTLSVIGLKGGLYSPVKIDNDLCIFASDSADVATVGANDGIVHAVAAGKAVISITYGVNKDVVSVTVS